MPNFRRYYVLGSTVFITNVTNNRFRYLQPIENIELLWVVLGNVQEIHPFSLFAYVILPDHFHILIKVDSSSENFSRVMRSIKANYTIEYKKCYGIETPLKLWHARFWDHIIRNEQDLENHIHCIHQNPVKHGYVNYPEEWVYSSYIHWLENGYSPVKFR
jgi:putative transposase